MLEWMGKQIVVNNQDRGGQVERTVWGLCIIALLATLQCFDGSIAHYTPNPAKRPEVSRDKMGPGVITTEPKVNNL